MNSLTSRRIQLAIPRKVVLAPAPNWNTVEVVFERSCDGHVEARFPDLPGGRWLMLADVVALGEFFGFVSQELRDYEERGEVETRSVSWGIFS